MSLRIIHLRKLLKILYSDPNRRVSSLRSDIRDDIARESGLSAGGGDFYGPFWRDAKNHVFHGADLSDATEGRIQSNGGRANLYPRLTDGFLIWWNDRRRWTNEPFHESSPLKAQFQFPGLDAIVKVDNILSVRDGRGANHFIYPYFSPEPILHDEAARLGLWLLHRSIPDVELTELSILDVIRGQTFSVDRVPLVGDEEAIFVQRYGAALDQWTELRGDYQ